MHVATQDTENNAITRNTEDSESTAITGDITDAARSPETLKHCCYWKHWNENNVVTENTAVIDNGNTEDISVTGSKTLLSLETLETLLSQEAPVLSLQTCTE